MEKSKIIIIAAIVVLAAVIGLNFDKITGGATRGILMPTVTIYPMIVNAGEDVNIKVKPNKGCVDPEIGLYFSGRDSQGNVGSSGGRKASITQKGGFKICKGDGLILDKDGTFTVQYTTRPEWDGEYFAKVEYWKDRTTKDSINAYFKVNPT